MKSFKLLFICTGNSCRSPMAEGYAKKVGFDAFSRGTLGVDGLPADEKAIMVCSEVGIDISSHRALSLSEQDLIAADFVLCMEKKHIDYIKRNFPLYISKVYLLGDFAGLGEIEDPIGGSVDDYRRAFEKIIRSIDGFREKVSIG